MTWAWALLGPLGGQAVAMTFDELHFHRRRGLDAWERVGHPIDTFTVILCIGWVLAGPPTSARVAAYVALSIVSCLCITKDEFVHARRCRPAEHWIHALLFVLHPICLAATGILWTGLYPGSTPAALDAVARLPVARILDAELLVICLFAIHQTVYWNLPWRRRAVIVP